MKTKTLLLHHSKFFQKHHLHVNKCTLIYKCTCRQRKIFHAYHKVFRLIALCNCGHRANTFQGPVCKAWQNSTRSHLCKVKLGGCKACKSGACPGPNFCDAFQSAANFLVGRLPHSADWFKGTSTCLSKWFPKASLM